MGNRIDDTANKNNIVVVPDILEDINNGDLGDANTSYSYVPWGSKGFRLGSFTIALTATTITLEATNDPSSIANGSATWVDITEGVFGVASVTTDTEFILDTPVIFSRFRFKRLTTNATNAFELRACKAN